MHQSFAHTKLSRLAFSLLCATKMRNLQAAFHLLPISFRASLIAAHEAASLNLPVREYSCPKNIADLYIDSRQNGVISSTVQPPEFIVLAS